MRYFSINEDEFIIQNHAELSIAELGRKLGRNRASIENRIARIRNESPNLLPRKKHALPRLSVGDIRIRRKANMDGMKVSKHFILIALRPKTWKLYCSFVWEQAYGSISAGQCVTHLNGDILDCRLENLALKSRTDYPIEKKNSHRLTDGWIAYILAPKDKELRAEILTQPALIELKRQQLILERLINPRPPRNA